MHEATSWVGSAPTTAGPRWRAAIFREPGRSGAVLAMDAAEALRSGGVMAVDVGDGRYEETLAAAAAAAAYDVVLTAAPRHEAITLAVGVGVPLVVVAPAAIDSELVRRIEATEPDEQPVLELRSGSRRVVAFTELRLEGRLQMADGTVVEGLELATEDHSGPAPRREASGPGVAALLGAMGSEGRDSGAAPEQTTTAIPSGPTRVVADDAVMTLPGHHAIEIRPARLRVVWL